MATRLINVDRATPLLLPPDLRDWVPEDDMVHFVIEAVQGMELSTLKVNIRGTGSEQYPPKMMLALLIYCYANGIFSSRRIERATYLNVAVRYLTGDTHPDHDTICSYRRANFDVVAEAFLQVLRLAREMGVLKVGTVSVDSTCIQANASLHRNVRYGRAKELDEQLRKDIESLLQKADQTDSEDGDNGQTIPEAIKHRKRLREKLQEAQKRLEAQGQQQAQAEREEYERKMRERQHRRVRGRRPKPPEARPTDQDMINMTDPDSRPMRKGDRNGYEQMYNAQAVVDADGSQLILAGHVINSVSDKDQLAPSVETIDPTVGFVTTVLADSGYVNIEQIESLQQRKIETYIAVTHCDNHHHRRYDFRPQGVGRKRKNHVLSPVLLKMQEKLRTVNGRALYSKRKQTVEPVFGIIKTAMGYRQFLLRGLAKVRGEWSLLRLAYNMKRLWSLQTAS